jgi:hypothetical protein
MDDGHVQKVRALIRQNGRLTVREVAEEAGTCKSSCHQIMTDQHFFGELDDVSTCFELIRRSFLNCSDNKTMSY